MAWAYIAAAAAALATVSYITGGDGAEAPVDDTRPSYSFIYKNNISSSLLFPITLLDSIALLFLLVAGRRPPKSQDTGESEKRGENVCKDQKKREGKKWRTHTAAHGKTSFSYMYIQGFLFSLSLPCRISIRGKSEQNGIKELNLLGRDDILRMNSRSIRRRAKRRKIRCGCKCPIFTHDGQLDRVYIVFFFPLSLEL